ncbi:MAG: hypothetical protein DRG78_15370 [Epsilonproteobacteria bacterium]|nr:MAG: hypothetical protein DRG78_15370 [Campylobacterota bacterium]
MDNAQIIHSVFQIISGYDASVNKPIQLSTGFLSTMIGIDVLITMNLIKYLNIDKDKILLSEVPINILQQLKLEYG